MSDSNINTRSSILTEAFNLSYTVLGDGKKSKIVPLSTGALSATGDCLFGADNESFASFKSDDSANCWRCNFCSYVNADGTSNTCSICGAERSSMEEAADNFDAQIPNEEKKPHTDSSERKPVISFHLEETKPSADRNIEDDDFEEKKPRAENSDAKTTISFDLEELPTANQNIEDSNFEEKEPTGGNVEDKNDDDDSLNPFSNHSKKGSTHNKNQQNSASFRNLMTMSYAKWSENDDKPWTCASCTFLNVDPRHLICEVCSQPRADQDAWDNESDGEQEETLEERRQRFLELEEKALEQERATELIKEQTRILSEIEEERRRLAVEQSEPEKEEANEELKATKRRLEETTEALARMKKIIDLENEEQETFEENQRGRFEELEEEVISVIGMDPTDDQNDTIEPGASHMEALEWVAQQRMLEEWREMTSKKQMQLEVLEQKKERLMQEYNRQSSELTEKN